MEAASFIATWNFEGKTEESSEILKEKNDLFGASVHQKIIKVMIEAFKEDRDSIVSGSEGLAPAELTSTILKSAETGKRIIL